MSSIWKLFSLGVCVLLLSTCRSTGLVGGLCTERLVQCGNECVDVGGDEQHCGNCETACRSDQSCRLGQCLPTQVTPRPSTGGSQSMPSSSLHTEAGVIPSNGGLDASLDASTDAASPSASASASSSVDGGPEPCIPPYESAERCGACDITCGPEAPFCGDLGQGYVCVSGCPPQQSLCADRCVDVATDEWNCGMCGVLCPTGICRDSNCVGGHAGHLVVACTSYEQAFASSPQTVLLGNAVFLNAMANSRVMLFEGYSNGATRTGLRKALGWAGTTHNAVVDLTPVSYETDIVNSLNADDFDVLLLADPNQAPSGVLGAFGQAVAATLDTFIRNGGSVVVMNGSTTSEITDFLGSQGANLLEVRGMSDVTFSELNNRAAGDSLTSNVLSPFLGLSTTCVYDMDPVFDVSIVITGAPGDGGPERPVVLHRVVDPT